LASASEQTREQVSRAGGHASHEIRGLQGTSSEMGFEVARRVAPLGESVEVGFQTAENIGVSIRFIASLAERK